MLMLIEIDVIVEGKSSCEAKGELGAFWCRSGDGIGLDLLARTRIGYQEGTEGWSWELFRWEDGFMYPVTWFEGGKGQRGWE